MQNLTNENVLIILNNYKNDYCKSEINEKIYYFFKSNLKDYSFFDLLDDINDDSDFHQFNIFDVMNFFCRYKESNILE